MLNIHFFIPKITDLHHILPLQLQTELNYVYSVTYGTCLVKMIFLETGLYFLITTFTSHVLLFPSKHILYLKPGKENVFQNQRW